MATSTKKKFAIPSLSEMGNDGSSKTDKDFSTFKTRKEEDGANTSNAVVPVKNVESVSHVSSNQQTTVENILKTGAEMAPNSHIGLQSTLDKHVENEKDKPKPADSEPFPTLAKLGTTNSVIVNPRQRGNPILKHIRNIPWEYGNIIPDYVMGQATCALFLRYHQLHPNYIHDRLKSLGKSFDLRVLLVQVDLADPHHLLKDLSNICILADCTLMLAFTAEEAGRYLETYKIYENKSPEAIMEKSDSNFMTKLTDCFTTVKSVNKTDCNTLISSFKTIEDIMNADKEDLGLCPGFGPQKAKRLYDLLHEPFIKYKKPQSNRPNLDTDQQESSSSTVT